MEKSKKYFIKKGHIILTKLIYFYENLVKNKKMSYFVLKYIFLNDIIVTVNLEVIVFSGGIS